MNRFASLSKIISVLLLVVFSVTACNSQEEDIPQNIIFLIGDGMGMAQITAGFYEFEGLNMKSMPYSGIALTHAANRRVTDSAASGTALAAGYKTNNGMLGQLPDGTPVQSIAHYAAELGKRTAIIANCAITHATPASFIVHHHARGDAFIIADQIAESNIDMLLGSGYRFFLPESEGGGRTDNRNLITEMKERGYVFINDENEMDRMAGQDKVLAFFGANHLERYPERGDVMNRLTAKALDQLSQNKDGFFMMIEGAMIDWGGHANDPDYMLQELEDFDNVIGNVLEFARNDGNTLVVVTADHETGGLTLTSAGEDMNYEWSTGGHSASVVPIFSYGPGAERFSGMMDNTEIARIMFELWGGEPKTL